MSHRFWKRKANKYIMKTLRGKTVILNCCKEKSLQKTLAYRAKSSFLLPFFRCFVAVPHWNLPRPNKKAVNFNIVKKELSYKPKKCVKRVRDAQGKERRFLSRFNMINIEYVLFTWSNSRCTASLCFLSRFICS